jgi:hypothetical protein
MLWECYAALLRDSTRLSFAQAQERMKEALIASLKLTPPNPTLLEARDALLAAALARDPADQRLFLQAFARRGAGTRAVGPDRYSPDHAGVVESQAAGDDVALVSVSLDDSTTAPCGPTGVLAAGGAGLLTVTVRNVGPDVLSATTATVGSVAAGLGFPGGTILTFGAMAPGAIATSTLPVTLAASVSGIQALTLTLTVSDAAMTVPLVVEVGQRANYETLAGQSATDDVESEATSWTTASGIDSTPGMTWRRVERSATDHRWLSPALASSGDEMLVSPAFTLGVGPASITFRHRHDYDVAMDSTGALVYSSGGILEVSTDGATWSDLGTLATPAYTATLDTRIPGTYRGHRAFTGRSAGFPDRVITTVDLGTRYAGRSIQVRFLSVVNPVVFAPGLGWEVDDIALSGTIDLPFDALVGRSGACAQVPTASATAPATGTAGSPVQLDGSASSDPDHRALSYHWVQVAGPVAIVTGADAARPSFTVSSLGDTQPVSFALRVSNGQRWSAPAEVTVTVSPAPPSSKHGGGCSSGGLDGSLGPLLGLGLWLALRRRRRVPASP